MKMHDPKMAEQFSGPSFSGHAFKSLSDGQNNESADEK